MKSCLYRGASSLDSQIQIDTEFYLLLEFVSFRRLHFSETTPPFTVLEVKASNSVRSNKPVKKKIDHHKYARKKKEEILQRVGKACIQFCNDIV